MRSGSVVVPGWSPDGNAQFPVLSANMDVCQTEKTGLVRIPSQGR